LGLWHFKQFAEKGRRFPEKGPKFAEKSSFIIESQGASRRGPAGRGSGRGRSGTAAGQRQRGPRWGKPGKPPRPAGWGCPAAAVGVLGVWDSRGSGGPPGPPGGRGPGVKPPGCRRGSPRGGVQAVGNRDAGIAGQRGLRGALNQQDDLCGRVAGTGGRGQWSGCTHWQ
jgi:hypothetical protein